ncbi:MAG: THUMP-like domain-containing protein [Aestuariibaculum sp.]
MNTEILNTEAQDFITSNLYADVSILLLKGLYFKHIETKEIIEQIEAKKRSEKKLPSWFNTPKIYYPNKLNIEQTSSEITAKYKANLILGKSIIDLTGGFGVDCYYFSKRFKRVTYCEINPILAKIATHNFKSLHVNNIDSHPVDGITYLKNTNTSFDWIYIDPSRRHDSKGKVFFLKDCLPDVPQHIDILFKHTKNILIKTSPLLDLSVGIGELKHVKTIHVIAVNNEVKELLWVLEKEFNSTISIKTVNIKDGTPELFSFYLEEEKHTEAPYHLPLGFLYEPNSAILKTGAFHLVAKQYNIFKLHQHSHLYTSKDLIGFSGRIFKIENVIPFNKKAIKKQGITKANITTRNFPETVSQIRKKFSIKDGGDTYLFFTTDMDNNKIMLVCTKIKT